MVSTTAAAAFVLGLACSSGGASLRGMYQDAVEIRQEVSEEARKSPLSAGKDVQASHAIVQEPRAKTPFPLMQP